MALAPAPPRAYRCCGRTIFVPGRQDDVAAVERTVADAVAEVHDRLGLRLVGIVIHAGQVRRPRAVLRAKRSASYSGNFYTLEEQG